ncbi:MAG: protein phosphatase 2C domain-containing protein [Nocardioides sp.]
MTPPPHSNLAAQTWLPPNAPAGLSIRYATHTHPGRVRRINEDSSLAQPPVFLVADGMGGHQHGDVASALVVETFGQLAGMSAVSVGDIEACVESCQRRVSALADDSGAAPGSTLVAVVFVVHDGSAYWLLANVGDSRAYQWLDGQLEQLSHDHSVVQELIDAGELTAEEIANHPERHVVTRALGAISDVEADYSLIPVKPNSTLLLCSDGISTELDDAAIGATLQQGAAQATEHLAQELVEAALRAGGRDNATALVIEVLGGQALEDTAGAMPRINDDDTVPGLRRRA